MGSRARRLLLGLSFTGLLATACGATTETVASGDDEINYRSTAGQEFTLTTTVTFPVPDEAKALEGDARQAAITARADALRTQVAAAISADLDRIWPEEKRTEGEGLVIQYHQGSATMRDLKQADGGLYAITVSGEFSATNDIASKLPMKKDGDASYYPLTFDAGSGPQELRLVLAPVERSSNAYPKYLELFEDGLDVSVHVGGDHNTPPQDINHARSIYDDLVRSGFKAPAAKFEDLKLDSGPFTKQVVVSGKPVDVRIRLYHVDMAPPDARQPLVDAYKASMKSADVVIYDGHAGRRLDYSGVVLAYNPARVSVPATEFASIESTAKQQIYLFNGCETYTGYADKLFENPNRKPENTDVVTTANYSAIFPQALQVNAFLHALLDAKNGTWVPRSWDSILGKMNAVGERAWVHVYGVTGIDDDPNASPLADPSKVGAACRTDADCGAADSRCLQKSSTERVCGIACADDAGCPSGTKCVMPRGRSSVDDKQCAAF